MKTKRILFGFLILSLLSCNYVTQLVLPPTATPLPTSTPTASPSPTPTPLLPAYIPPQCSTAPLATLSPGIAAQINSQPGANPDVSKREQLRIFEQVVDKVKHVYVYPDFNGKDWNEIENRYRARIETGLDTESFYREMRSMIDELQDDHSIFITPLEVAQDEAELKGDVKFVGIGIYGQPDFEKGDIVVISTYPGSPAEYAGIQSHDSILLVDGSPVSNEEGFRMRGPECSAVVLKVQSPGELPRDAMLIRSPIDGNIPIEARLVPTTDGSKIGYIFIPSFFDETLPPQIEDALNKFGQLDGLILDVRLNGGGASTVIYPILEFFTNGRLGEFTSRDESRPLIINENPIQNSQTVPLVVMVSKETVSFGEIFAGIMRDARGAKITGETSLGNVEILNGYDFKDGSVLWIAAEKFHSAFSDIDWEETGIVPDVQAYAPWDTFYFDTDPSIAVAVKLLGHE